MSESAPAPSSFEQRIGGHLAVVFSLIILLYAAGGPIADGLRSLIELTTNVSKNSRVASD